MKGYPLTWPPSKPRSRWREVSRYKVSFGIARSDLCESLRLLGVDERTIVISTNIRMRVDGMGPLSGQKQPDDPGVAVYFEWKKKQACFAVDKYLTVRENMRAIGLTIDALRAIKRAGAGDMLDTAFIGFTALPASVTPPPEAWWVVLKVAPEASLEDVKKAYRARSAQTHPDAGGNPADFDKVQRAFREAKAEISQR